MNATTALKGAAPKPYRKRLRCQPKARAFPAGEAGSGAALRAWRNEAGLNRPTFAQLANLSERTLATYEKAPQVPALADPQVTEARRLVEALRELVPAAQLSGWLQTPNPGFEGRTPLALIRAGQRDLLWEMVYQTRHGAFA